MKMPAAKAGKVQQKSPRAAGFFYVGAVDANAF
jgi:hypothetical protein